MSIDWKPKTLVWLVAISAAILGLVWFPLVKHIAVTTFGFGSVKGYRRNMSLLMLGASILVVLPPSISALSAIWLRKVNLFVPIAGILSATTLAVAWQTKSVDTKPEYGLIFQNNLFLGAGSLVAIVLFFICRFVH